MDNSFLIQASNSERVAASIFSKKGTIFKVDRSTLTIKGKYRDSHYCPLRLASAYCLTTCGEIVIMTWFVLNSSLPILIIRSSGSPFIAIFVTVIIG